MRVRVRYGGCVQTTDADVRAAQRARGTHLYLSSKCDGGGTAAIGAGGAGAVGSA